MSPSSGQQSFIEATGRGAGSPHYHFQPADGSENRARDEYDQHSFQQIDAQRDTEDISTLRAGAQVLSIDRLTSTRRTSDDDPADLEDVISSKDSTKAPSIPQRRKVIQRSSAGPTIWQLLVFQFPALAVTTALLILYLKNVSFNPTADQLGALLVAAKAHETLIIASLSNIVLYHIRRGLLGPQGIPFGFLTAPFQLMSPLYLFTSEFWSCAHSINMYSALLALLVVVSFALATLAGASSSIIIIPKLGWRALPGSYAVSPSTSVFPLNIDLSIVPENCKNTSGALYTNFGDRSYWPEMVNLTISNGDWRTMNFFSNTTHGQLAVATTPSTFAADAINPGRFGWDVGQENPVKIVADLRDMNGNMMTMKQPRVITQCSDPITGFQGQDINPLYYNFRILRLFYPQFNFTVPKTVFQDSLDYRTRLGFIDVNEYLPDSINTSVAIWIRGLYKKSLSICLVDARWIATDAWILPLNAGSKIEHSLTINTNQTTTYENGRIRSHSLGRAV
ncbi:hypothetical protein NUW58_g9862 [Xylaria curta]|uniref:Uncharacterized protein n=1 Tax=Xylaria curta TaxID=42375 RepID=A0ACC1MST5_9PEZI|nr:hypothetical protein NUW58_g9862 [Xylaria curta]